MTTESGFDAYLRRILQEDKNILEALGSDYDEDGIPYWDKWGDSAHKKAIDKNQPDDVE